MARVKFGALGGFTGKIGNVVVYNLGDETFGRSAPKSKTYFTAAELENQAKFKMVHNHLEPLLDLLKVGFRNYYTKTGGYRAALAYTRKEVLVKDDAGFYIDPALFKISGGNLPGAVNPTVTITEPKQLRIEWDTSNLDREIKNDQLMVLVYDMVNFKHVKRIFNGVFRQDGALNIAIPSVLDGKNVHVYIGFVAADRLSQSDSQYLGMVTIPKDVE